jgi:predicted nucleic acid-binding protein
MASALDANLLLRFFQRSHPLHPVSRAAVRRLRASGEALYVLPQNVAEFWCVATRPVTARGGFGLSLAQAQRQVRLMERLFPVLDDTPGIYAEWRRLVVQYGVSGVQVYDARIAACLRVHGVTRLLTFNAADFARYAGFVAVDPAQV